ncbi:hypothetical protein EYC59_04775 [Candidatus Saccharibacteria bacterium]|nr:MAG: hypothetical protein EYC59_04775 [Candidatus Saccharibacteria bacterium]
MSEFLNPGHFVPNKRGRIPTILFVATTVGATAAALIFAPKVGATEEIGHGTATLQYGETVEHAIAEVCDQITGKGASD